MVVGDPVTADATSLAGPGLPSPGGSTLIPPPQVSV